MDINAMTESPYEQELLKELQIDILSDKISICYDNSLLDKFSNAFEFELSRLAYWKHNNYIIKNVNNNNPADSSTQIFEKMFREFDVEFNTSVIVFGDQLTNLLLCMNVSTFLKYTVSFVSIPHITYIVPPDVKWCMCYAMEDYICAVFNKSNNINHAIG